ncbi:hypothetical protein L6258_00090, partial [Candidatus Parcubacteria bacterium]|nr:hypothetical protein [Candidatus Parcubacteria bacterium]
MLQQNADARIASNLIDITHQKHRPKKVELDYKKIERIIGVPLKKTEIDQILTSLGFTIQSHTATVPSWRTGDISIPEDLAEEVARLYGYFNLPSVLPTEDIPIRFDQKKFHAEYQAKTYLARQGFFEAYTNTATSRKILKSGGVDPRQCLKLKNPLSQEFEYLRTSLIPQLLEIISRNQNYSAQLRLFEMAHTYLPKKRDELPKEQLRLTGIIADTIATTFYTTKVTVKNLLEELGIRDVQFHAGELSQIGTVNKIFLGKVELGSVVQPDSEILNNFGIKRDVTVFDLDFEQLSPYVKLEKQLSPYVRLEKTYRPIPKFPPTIEELSIIVTQSTPVDDLKETIEQCSDSKVHLSAVLADDGYR